MFLIRTLFVCGALFIPPLTSAIGILSKTISLAFQTSNFDIILVLKYTILVIVEFSIGALFIPFWQSLKAVSYYHLKQDSEDT